MKESLCVRNLFAPFQWRLSPVHIKYKIYILYYKDLLIMQIIELCVNITRGWGVNNYMYYFAKPMFTN